MLITSTLIMPTSDSDSWRISSLLLTSVFSLMSISKDWRKNTYILFWIDSMNERIRLNEARRDLVICILKNKEASRRELVVLNPKKLY